MRAGTRYALLTALVALGVALAGWRLTDGAERSAVWWGLGLALLVQVPLGWWVVRSVGTGRFLGAWAIGMLARLALLGGLALAAPLLWLDRTVLLVTAAGALMALLLVEGVVALMQLSDTTGR